MAVEGVFAPGVSGMGPALTPKGERIVNERIARRDRVLDDLERRGLNTRALAHRHRGGCGHSCADGCHHEECESRKKPESSALPESLEEAQARILRLEGQIAHLEHQIAVQDNMVKLLREALSDARVRISGT